MVCFWTQKCWSYRHNLTERARLPENYFKWELLSGMHLPPVWLVIPNRSHPQAFQDHYFSAWMKQNSDWSKLPGEKSSACRLPQCPHLSLICSVRLPGGKKQILAKYESSHPWVDIKNRFDAYTLKLLISLLWLQRQSWETRSKISSLLMSKVKWCGYLLSCLLSDTRCFPGLCLWARMPNAERGKYLI